MRNMSPNFFSEQFKLPTIKLLLNFDQTTCIFDKFDLYILFKTLGKVNLKWVHPI